MLLSFMQYPELPKGTVGVGSTHHFALIVDSAEEQEAARLPARPRRRVHRRLRSWLIPSIYLRDPDGHIVEIATRGPGFPAPAAQPHSDPDRSAGA